MKASIWSKRLQRVKQKKTVLEQNAKERLELITEMKKSIDEASYIREAERLLSDFWAHQDRLKLKFDSESTSRDVHSVFEKHGLVFAHGMSPRGSVMLASAISDRGFNSLGNRLRLISGFQPTLSAYVFVSEGGVLRCPGMHVGGTGVLLSGGKLLDIAETDLRSKPVGLYSRIPRSDMSNIHKDDFDAHLDRQSRVIRDGDVNVYPEAIVEDPQIGALFYVKNGHDSLLSKSEFLEKFESLYGAETNGMNAEEFAQANGITFREDIEELRLLADEIGVPVVEVLGKEVSGFNGENFFATKDIDAEKKAELSLKVLEENPFRIESANKLKFDAVKEGMAEYSDANDITKRLDYSVQDFKENMGRLARLKEQILSDVSGVRGDRLANLEYQRKAVKRSLEQSIYHIYGIVRGARESGHAPMEEYALGTLRSLLEESGLEMSVDKFDEWYQSHTDKHGEYIMKSSDIPFDVRTRLHLLEEESNPA